MMEKDREVELNRRINETASEWQSPFGSDSLMRAKVKVMARTVDKAAPAGKVIQIRSRITAWAAAAAIALLVGLPFLIHFAGNTLVTNDLATEMKVDLPDGSVATLAPEAHVRYNGWLWNVKRSMDLSGAAFFEVKRGSNFFVETSLGAVEVRGTAFSVWSSPSRLLVHCLSGKVTVHGNNAQREMAPGSLAEITRSRGNIEVSEHRTENPVMPGGEVLPAFENTPLPLVVAMLERAFEIEITSYLDTELRFTGELRADARDESLQILCKTFGATYVEDGKSITLMP